MAGLVEGLNQQADLELVCDGSSSYLLLLDSLLVEDPDDKALLVNTTKAYSAYVAVMPECGRPGRSAILSEKTRQYGLRLLLGNTGIKQNDTLDELSTKLQASGRGEVEALFWGAYGWATWISFQQGAPAAVIDLPKVEMIMKRVVELDETFYNGGAHLFLGIYYTLKPAIYGGDPDASRSHFEKALAISANIFLPIQVAYANNYAKMVFDRELYKKLLEEVLLFDLSTAPALTLSNRIAQKQARRLLNEIDEYF
ncbi:MAG: TRAP transporter TatT component family protein [Thermodesulfobacteriota bacterium]